MDAERHFQFLAAAAIADKTLGSAEKQTLLRLAQELGLPTGGAMAIIETMKKQEAIDPTPPEDPGERKVLFRQVVEVLAADGKIPVGEAAYVDYLRKRFEFTSLEM